MTERTAEEWGRVALAVSGWRWVEGMRNGGDGTRYMGGRRWAWDDPLRHHALGICNNDWPDLDDPATVGCLVAMLAPVLRQIRPVGDGWQVAVNLDGGPPMWCAAPTIGRACVMAAEVLCKWPDEAQRLASPSPVG